MSDKKQKLLRLRNAERLAEVADARDMNQNELVDWMVEEFFGVDEDSEEYLINELEELISEEEELREELRDIASRLRDIHQMKTDINERLADIRENRDELADIIDSVLTHMDENPKTNIRGYRSEISDAVKVKFGGSPTDEKREQMISEIADISEERDDISVDPSRFMTATTATGGSSASAADGGGKNEAPGSLKNRMQQLEQEADDD